MKLFFVCHCILAISDALSFLEQYNPSRSVDVNTNIDSSTKNIISKLRQELGLSVNNTTLQSSAIVNHSMKRTSRWRRHRRSKRHQHEFVNKHSANSPGSSKTSSDILHGPLNDLQNKPPISSSSTHDNSLNDASRSTKDSQSETNKNAFLLAEKTTQLRCENDSKGLISPSSCNDVEINHSLEAANTVLAKNKLTINSGTEISKTTSRSNFIIIDDFGGFFRDNTDNHKRKANFRSKNSRPTIFDYIIGEPSDIPMMKSKNRFEQWNLWDIEADRALKIKSPNNTVKDMVTDVDVLNHGSPIKSFDVKSKISEMKIEKISQDNWNRVLNDKSNNCVPTQVLIEGDFQSAFLSTFYISVTACVVLFAVGLWWRRYLKTKKVKLPTLSGTIPLKTTREHGQLVI